MAARHSRFATPLLHTTAKKVVLTATVCLPWSSFTHKVASRSFTLAIITQTAADTLVAPLAGSMSGTPCIGRLSPLRNPRGFAEVGVPLPEEDAVNLTTTAVARNKRKWVSTAWTLLAVVVVSCGIAYMFYLSGRIGGRRSPHDESFAGGSGGETPSPAPVTSNSLNETSAPTNVPVNTPPPAIGEPVVPWKPPASPVPTYWRQPTSPSSVADADTPAPSDSPTSTPAPVVAIPWQPALHTIAPTVEATLVMPMFTSEPTTTTRQTPAPTTQPPVSTLPQLTYTGWCSEEIPCFACQGECTLDDHCAPGLACFPRDGWTPIPGCSGSGISDLNYCFVPSNPILVHLGDCPEEDPCELCQGERSEEKERIVVSFLKNERSLSLPTGDCDNDDQCAPGLVCFLREGYDPVPGCAGLGYKEKDYCIEYGLSEPSVLPTPKPTTPILTIDPVLVDVGDCSSESPCGLCEGVFVVMINRAACLFTRIHDADY